MAGGEVLKLEFAFGVGERGVGRRRGEPDERVGNGLGGDGIDDGALKGAGAGGRGRGLGGRWKREEKKLRGEENGWDETTRHIEGTSS